MTTTFSHLSHIATILCLTVQSSARNNEVFNQDYFSTSFHIPVSAVKLVRCSQMLLVSTSKLKFTTLRRLPLWGEEKAWHACRDREHHLYVWLPRSFSKGEAAKPGQLHRLPFRKIRFTKNRYIALIIIIIIIAFYHRQGKIKYILVLIPIFQIQSCSMTK